MTILGVIGIQPSVGLANTQRAWCVSGVVLEPGDSVVSRTVWTPRGAYGATGKAEKARLIIQSFWIDLL